MQKTVKISGLQDDMRLESRILEEKIQEAVAAGARELEIQAFGQHGIGGRLWISKQEPLNVKVLGSSGQRLGSMGFPGTSIEAFGPASDDIGWLNAGAEIIVHGDGGNGACNAMAQGKVYVAGSVGARCMTMTKQNPRFAPPELWILNGVGDYFAEFMAGGIAVVCGVDPRNKDNVLGYRPCVGMVGGKIFFRGPYQGFSETDAKLIDIDDENWSWLKENIKVYLKKINRSELLEKLTVREEWQLIVSKTPYEKVSKKRRSMSEFHSQVWDGELGRGGMIGDLTSIDRSPIGLIVTDEMRRFVPVWENDKYLPPCQASCPSGIPVQKRWKLVREGKMEEAVNLSLEYTPFPASVCGHLCPNLCMEGCTRAQGNLAPVDAQMLGKAGLSAEVPELPELSGKRVAVIGGGPAGISVAWQLRRFGHEAVVFDMQKQLGGKMTSAIPESRIPKEVLEAELKRIRKVLPHIIPDKKLGKEEFENLKQEYDFVVLASGAQRPRTLPVPGKERLVPALDFLQAAKQDKAKVGEKVVIIGAGNVGCDVATEAARLGGKELTLIDVQKPASFGKEREEAEKAGAIFKWPCFTKEVTDKGVVLTTGELLEADTVIISIGDQPELENLPDSIATERGLIKVNDIQQTTDARVFAIGDIAKMGLLTDAIGAGRKAAEAIHSIFSGKRPLADTADMLDQERTSLEYVDHSADPSETIDYSRMTLEYFDPRLGQFHDLDQCALECSSCGSCRDCGLCETICPRTAISRKALLDGEFEMISDPTRCIGCGFCANACPCGIWSMVSNTPIG